MVGSCNDLLANLQLSILDKFGWEPKVMHVYDKNNKSYGFLTIKNEKF